MWCVIQTRVKQEELLQQNMQAQIPEHLMQECFVLKRVMNRRLGGKWQPVTQIVFGGYVFVVTDQPEALYMELKKIPKFAKLLCSDSGCFLSPTEKELSLIRKFGNRHTIGISVLDFDSEGKICYIDGDVKIFADEIIGVDKKNKKVFVRMEWFGEEQQIHFGFEYLRKNGLYVYKSRNEGMKL